MLLSISYPDRNLRLIAIPLWGFLYRNIGEVASFGQLLKDPQYYLDLGVAILVTFLIWELNRFFILRFDKKYSWVDQAFPRALIQGATCFGLSSFMVLMATFVYNTYLAQRHPLFNIEIVFMTDIPMACMFLLVMHLLYTGMWLRVYHQRVVEGLQEQISSLENSSPLNANMPPTVRALRSLLVNQGKAQVPLNLEEIAYLSVAGDLCVIRNLQGQSFTIDQTLEQLEESLPGSEFFRLNRQIIAHRQAIRKVETEGSGRLLLQLNPAFSEEVTVSRKKANTFRAWMIGQQG
ncbi:MAG: LytTR family DNA-binding domain-containing protein [Haliscomenobacter sp.]|uniref:LytR/AlgR family response regulator transcription factor n=1 Tax=Haliscomenobacter sp. TaxID=2717303 RepID=UPI0029AA60B3|nr:LytTR family DNA-binding domain-containing protein [Haliscomenobacter sp.]MDX2067243.1 LytTR family DNA-binding domain-containing protein [Haliscomenobacter sp.]